MHDKPTRRGLKLTDRTMKKIILAAVAAAAITNTAGPTYALTPLQKCMVRHGFGPEANHIPYQCVGL
jgi:hypothetical protein